MWPYSDTILVSYFDSWLAFFMLQHFQHFKACGLNGHRSKKNLDLFALILWVSHQDLFWYRSLAASLVVLSVGKVCFISAELQIWSVVYAGTFLSVKTRNHTLSYRTMNAITFWRIVWVRKNLKRPWENISQIWLKIARKWFYIP